MRRQKLQKQRPTRIGIVGSGFIARGLCLLLLKSQRYQISQILTRRPNKCQVASWLGVNQDQVSSSADELIDASDLVVECSGDPIHGTSILFNVLRAGLSVVTMDAELQITTGSWLMRHGYISEAEGDQPGCLASFHREISDMGFTPLVLGNIKSFLNHHPSLDEMRYWSEKSGISINQVVSFTDGTKVQIEQALVANGLNASIAQKGLLGCQCADLSEGALLLANVASSMGMAKISDYILSPKAPPGVFIVATHFDDQGSFLRYYKMGEGPYYVLVRPMHLCHIEILKTINAVIRGEKALLTNGIKPRVSVAAVAKRRLEIGSFIERGLGGFDFRGEAIKIEDYRNHVPIGLVSRARIRRRVEPEQMLTYDDIDLPESLALSAWQEIMGNAQDTAFAT